ncbi:hypothetical protein E2K98_02565 [Bacillus salipaludis]|uniref:Histidine kinase n=1 Tax=Bacillus salipaludis TaxID=2547811 RepID=A0A4R5VZR9_9BACI|nr:hypothetical protein [Bacillus salipaludis]MDQ6596379.1 hypothetical protein [Bacillus salipaludis]TDK65140.1 hypothetical protein E2K98_02565 [Bacillus salipaludis]
MKRAIYVIITMIIVSVLATWVLGKYHSEVPFQTRMLITAGGVLLSGILTIFMSRKDVGHVETKLK